MPLSEVRHIQSSINNSTLTTCCVNNNTLTACLHLINNNFNDLSPKLLFRRIKTHADNQLTTYSETYWSEGGRGGIQALD